jgi:hypothetical protein
MKYVTWQVYFPENSNEGSTPDPIIRERGFEAGGLFHIEPFVILGCISDNANITNLDNYKIKELTNQEALDLALVNDSGAHLDDSGKLCFTPFVKV